MIYLLTISVVINLHSFHTVRIKMFLDAALVVQMPHVKSVSG